MLSLLLLTMQVSSEEWDSDDGEQLFAADHGSDKPRPVSSQGGLLAVFEGMLACCRNLFTQKVRDIA